MTQLAVLCPLECRQGEGVSEDARNTAKSVQMIEVEDGRGPRYGVAGDSY